MDEPAVVNTSTPISGWNIFWTLLTLSLSCITHPVGSSCGFPRAFKSAVRINPFSTFFDSAHLLREVFLYRSSQHHSWHDALHHTVLERLNSNLTAARIVRDKDLKVVRADFRVRFIVSTLCILQYTKLYGYHGTPLFFSISTLLFITWFILEASLVTACLHHAPVPHRPIISPTHTLSFRAGVWSFVFLAAALLALALARIPIAAIRDAALGLAARWILVWHSGVLWLPLLLVGCAPASFRAFPNPDHGYLKLLLVLYGIMIGFLVLVVVYWVSAIAGMGIMVLPVYFTARVCWRVLCAAAGGGKRCCAAVAAKNPQHVVRVVAGAFVVGVVAGLGTVYEPEGTRKEWWTEWMP